MNARMHATNVVVALALLAAPTLAQGKRDRREDQREERREQRQDERDER